MTNLITAPFAWIMRLFFELTGSYGVALILFSLVVKLVLLPFQLKSKKSMVRMGRLSGKQKELERQYAHHFGRAGNQALPLRVAFGSLVIRQALELSDKQTVQMIRESPYLQYFIGMTSFEYQLPFVAHSMVGFRQRIPAQQIGQAVQMWKKFSREDMARKR